MKIGKNKILTQTKYINVLPGTLFKIRQMRNKINLNEFFFS